MADDSTPSVAQERQPGEARAGRPGGGREPGGFRIRLSDNEMRAARAIQDAFRLRSTVAALGFALRTTAQLLDEGQLDALVAQQAAQGPGPGRGGAGRREGRGERREDRRDNRGPRVDPFARPSRPAPAAPPQDLQDEPAAQLDEPAPPAEEAAPVAEASPEA
jgi:hypothetical protein